MSATLDFQPSPWALFRIEYSHREANTPLFSGPNGKPADRALALDHMRKHISTVVGHFKGHVNQWDVVNETISDSPQEVLRQSPWLKAIGEDYIAEAFRAAHAADPKAILVFNDYNIELSRRRAEAVVKALVANHGADSKRLRGAGVGMLAPAASNDADEGRAKNRRVEVVKLN